MIIKLWYWLNRRWRHIPCKGEISTIYSIILNQGLYVTDRKREIIIRYVTGMDLEQIAEKLNISSFRVWAIIWRIYHDYKKYL